MAGSCCDNWQAAWTALGIPGQAFADGVDGSVLPIAALKGAHKLFLRGRFQGHGTPVINCNSIGPTDPFNTGCCAFCGVTITVMAPPTRWSPHEHRQPMPPR